MKKLLLLLPIVSLLFLSKTTFGQEIIDTPIEHYIVQPKPYKAPRLIPPFAVTGRVIGINNLEILKGVTVINVCTGNTTTTNNNGIYHINAAKGDTLEFVIAKYSASSKCARSPKQAINVILFKRKTDSLPRGYTAPGYLKAQHDDDDLLRVLEKDAKLAGKWNY